MTIRQLIDCVLGAYHEAYVYAVLNGKQYPCNRYSRGKDGNIVFLLSHKPASAYKFLSQLRFLSEYADLTASFSYLCEEHIITAVEYDGTHLNLICGGTNGKDQHQ